MSVLIKGMEMPENCEKCPFIIEEDIDFDICRRCGAGKSGYIYEKDIDGFPFDCPLIALPDKHGRLIDAEELKKALDERFDEMRNMYPSIRFGPGWMLASSVIVHSPTVIEAEREEHEE